MRGDPPTLTTHPQHASMNTQIFSSQGGLSSTSLRRYSLPRKNYRFIIPAQIQFEPHGSGLILLRFAMRKTQQLRRKTYLRHRTRALVKLLDSNSFSGNKNLFCACLTSEYIPMTLVRINHAVKLKAKCYFYAPRKSCRVRNCYGLWVEHKPIHQERKYPIGAVFIFLSEYSRAPLSRSANRPLWF